MKYIISILLIAVLASCKTGKNAKSQEISSLYKKWELVTLNGEKVSQASPTYLNFNENNTVNGFLGCNSVNGSYTLVDKKIKLNQLATTRKACMDMSIEKELLLILNEGGTFTIQDGKLNLIFNGDEVATFSELIEGEISNKYWKLIELDGKQVQMVDNQEREQFAMFTNEGTVSGFSGCNHFNGFYQTAEGNQITIDDKISSTLKTCPDVDVDERAFIKALTLGSRYQIDGEKLVFLGRDGMKLAVFEAVYF